MPTCAIKGCKSNSVNAKERKVKLFSFPKNILIRDKWIKACKKEYKINETNARVCSKHFAPEAFDKPLIQKMLNYSPVNSRKLKPTAVPTEYLPPFAEVEIRIDELCKVIENIPVQENVDQPENENEINPGKARITYDNLLSTYEKLSNENEIVRSKNKALKLEYVKQSQLYEKNLAENVRLRAKNRILTSENRKLRQELKKLKSQLDSEFDCIIEDIECSVIDE